jgi:uncharacterized DUF497 family protein
MIFGYYHNSVKFDFDPAKSAKNVRERGLPFDAASGFDFHTATRTRDTRHDYGEERWVATGYIGTRLHVMCYTWTMAGMMRIISLRKANLRERRSYEKETTPLDE